MAAQREQLHLGFLSAISLPGRGHVGGLLVTNQMGRPLEFQCTAPVLPNRTQEILYGHTLQPYLLGEVIGKTLVEKMAVCPDVVIVDDVHLLEVRRMIKLPVILVPAATEGAGSLPSTTSVSLSTHPDFADDEPTIAKLKQVVAAEADLAEPLQRVREALREATGTSQVPTSSTAASPPAMPKAA